MSGEVSDVQSIGTNMELQELAMGAWNGTGVLTAIDKQVLNKPEVTELGIRIDGKKALLGCSPERLLKTAFATIFHWRNAVWSKKEAQIILGRWIFILQFRRAAMSCLSRAWETVEKPWPSALDRELLNGELATLLCLGPLLQTDLTSQYDGQVTCSDASGSGGAAAMACDLTWSGRSLLGRLSDRRLQALPIRVLVVSLFNGIGGAFRLYDVLGLQPQGRISVDISRCGNRVTRTTWPGVIELHDICSLNREDIKEWSNTFPSITELHLYAGFPCIHLSSVRAYRQNLDGEGSNLFWKMLQILGWIQEIFSTYCKVKFCVENVASMDEEARRSISDHLEVAPVKLDPGDCLPISRPRLAWCSEVLHQMEGLELWEERDYTRAYVKAGSVATEQWIRPGWEWRAPKGTLFPTFMKSIRRARPPPKPAGLDRCDAATRWRWTQDEFRFPPYQYKEQFLVSSPGQEGRVLDASEREILLGFGPQHTESCMSASDMKKNYKEYEDSRRSLCGDSFSILSFAIMASCMCAELAPRMRPELVVRRLGLAPGSSVHPSIQVPMTRWLSYGGNVELPHSSEELVRHLGLTVNHTGADVRIVSGELLGNKTPNHASIRAWWWQWKHLFKVKWKEHSHINYLEMKMILNTLLWKCRDPSKTNRRWLHVEDSMVCLYVLTKGRTSSHLLQPLVKRIGVVQLAMGSVLLHAHVGSAENPTDAASRD